jgi:hypothetical protein
MPPIGYAVTFAPPLSISCRLAADCGGSQIFPKAADGIDGGARVSYAGNLADRQLSELLTGRTTRHIAD